jgi:hypothetical protein
MRVTVVAPEEFSAAQVMPRVRRRAQWIVRQRTYFEQFQPKQPAQRYVSGETFRYLGRQYRLKVRAAAADSVKLMGRYLYVHSSQAAIGVHNKRLIDRWYRERGQVIFVRRLEACMETTRTLRVDPPEITFRKFAKRWGSCTRSGQIVLNTELLQAPVHCIDYVIIHELCHLKVRSHSPRFYALLSRMMPDWKRRKERLETVSFM